MRILISSLVVVSVLGAGCSDDGGSESSEPARGGSQAGAADAASSTVPGSSTTSTVAASTTSTSTTSTVLVPPDPEATDTAPVTTLPATAGVPEQGERFNEGGVPITLDETAALACANAQFAGDSINFDNLEQAQRDLDAAGDRAEPSAVADIAGSAVLLRGALAEPDPLVVVEEFLDICVEHGHQI